MIRSLQQNVSEEEALRILGNQGVFGIFSRALSGPLRTSALVYVPFRLYNVTITNGKKREDKIFAMDAVRGWMDLYGMDHVPSQVDLVKVETRNRLKPALDSEQAEKCLRDKVRRIVFGSGFFRVRNLNIETVDMGQEIHIPYWVGFYGPDQNLNIAVIDAVRRRKEGAKAKTLFMEWLTADRNQVVQAELP